MFRIQRSLVSNPGNLQNCIKRFRRTAFSSKSSSSGKCPTSDGKESRANGDHLTKETKGVVDGTKAAGHIDREIHLFGPRDARFPLPGDIGVDKSLTRNSGHTVQTRKLSVVGVESFLQTTLETKCVEISQLNDQIRNLILDQERETDAIDNIQMDCVANDAPQLLMKDFQPLFPNVDFRRKMTVITVCQKSKFDMVAWSEDVEEERENLIVRFVELAQRICNQLEHRGFWADFIDPYSGRAYLGTQHTNETLFETDDKYRHFGFSIEDLGCCKVISHHVWGTKSFVGSIFTEAPFDSDIIASLLDEANYTS